VPTVLRLQFALRYITYMQLVIWFNVAVSIFSLFLQKSTEILMIKPLPNFYWYLMVSNQKYFFVKISSVDTNKKHFKNNSVLWQRMKWNKMVGNPTNFLETVESTSSIVSIRLVDYVWYMSIRLLMQFWKHSAVVIFELGIGFMFFFWHWQAWNVRVWLDWSIVTIMKRRWLGDRSSLKQWENILNKILLVYI
jgi:hypothetical protein